MFVSDVGEVFNDTTDAVRAVSLVNDIAEGLQFAQQTQRWTRHFKHYRFLICWNCYRGVAFDAGEQRHLAEADARFELTNLLLGAVVAHVNIERTFDSNVEGVSTPLTLPHDLFAGIVSEQTRVRPHPLTVAIIATLNDYFEVTGILLFAVLFFEEFSSKSKILDGFKNATPIGDFAHGFFYIHRLHRIKKNNRCNLWMYAVHAKLR